MQVIPIKECNDKNKDLISLVTKNSTFPVDHLYLVDLDVSDGLICVPCITQEDDKNLIAKQIDIIQGVVNKDDNNDNNDDNKEQTPVKKIHGFNASFTRAFDCSPTYEKYTVD